MQNHVLQPCPETSITPSGRMDEPFAREAEAERQAILRCAQESARLEAIGLLASGVAHDFNNLLTGLLGSIQLAKEDVADRPGTFALLQAAEHAGMRARELCARVGDHVRRGTGEHAVFDLHALVHEAATLMAASAKRVRFEFLLDAPCATVSGVVIDVRRILLNLLVNASEAIGARGGRIRIASRCIEDGATVLGQSQESSFIELTVEDDGEGIAAAVIANIFDPFFTTKKTGTGLGLAGVKNVMTRHGGRIDVESTIGIGTRFRLVFPITRVRQAASEPGSGRLGRILVVDDDDLLCPMIGRVLRTQGFGVDEALNGTAALELYRDATEPYAAAMIDLTLPGMNGADLLASLRERGMKGAVVLMSGLEDTPTLRRIRRDDYSTFLRKPFGADAIVKAITQAVQATK